MAMNKKVCDIKIADISDVHDIALINVLSWQEAYKEIIPKKLLSSLSVSDLAEACKHCLQNGAVILVMKIENKVVGFSRLCKDMPSALASGLGEINAIYLHPDVWGDGYGKELGIASLEELKKLGFKEAVVWVISENSRARRFYESLGFKYSGASRPCNIIPDSGLNEVQYNKII